MSNQGTRTAIPAVADFVADFPHRIKARMGVHCEVSFFRADPASFLDGSLRRGSFIIRLEILLRRYAA